VDMTGPPGVDWGARGSGVPLVLMVAAGGGGISGGSHQSPK
jgi:hypothetical protein